MRNLLRAGTAGLCLLLSTSCASIEMIGAETVQTDLAGFESVEAQQEELIWCWAACASMIHQYAGREVSQEEIATRIHGHAGDGEVKVAAASRFEVYKALAPEATAYNFEQLWEAIAEEVEAEVEALKEAVAEGDQIADVDVKVDASVGVDAALDKFFPEKRVPIAGLEAGQPAVVGLRNSATSTRGHLCVIVGAEYLKKNELLAAAGSLGEETGLSNALMSADKRETLATLEEASMRAGFDPKNVNWVEIVDPWEADDPDTEINEMRKRIDSEDFVARATFVATVADATEILTRWGQLVQIETDVEAVQ